VTEEKNPDEKIKTAKDTGTFVRAGVCACGRVPRIDPETGKITKHWIGRSHPGFKGISRQKRKETWCPEVKD